MRIFLLSLITLISLTACDVSKVTDPDDPKFDPKEFKFEDYELNSSEMYEALNLVAPVGSYKNYVDVILLRNAKADQTLNGGCNNITYYKFFGISNKDRYIFNIKYDEQLRVVETTFTKKNKGILE